METRGSQAKQISQIENDLPLDVKSTVAHLKGSGGLSREHFSSLRLLYFIIISIFLAEVVAMVVVYRLPSLSYGYVTLIDAGIMTILIFPMLYFLSFKPLIHHIDKRQQTEQALQRVNRALSVLNECNQVLVRAAEETELLQEMCEIIVNTGEYRMAWIGFAEQDQAMSVRPAAQFGLENGYLDLAQITWADDERGRGPTGSAIRQGVVQVNQNFLANPTMAPWRESALLRGYQSSIALPLQAESSTFGALTIYSAQPDAFDQEEVHLLQELASDLAFGISGLRVRVERDRAQAEIREMALFPALNPDAVVRIDATGCINMANLAAEEKGLRVGNHLTEIIPSLHDLDVAACIASGATQQIPETYLGEQVLQWRIRGVPALRLAFLYSTDITLRKQAEERNLQLSRIVEQTEDTVVVTNNQGVIEYINPAFERLTGYTKEEALGKTPSLLKSGVHDDGFYRELWNTILQGNAFQGEISNRKKNGELFHEAKTITPLRDVQGQITHFVATGKDITQHKLDEEKLLKAFDELELRIHERTEELRLANTELEEEINVRRQMEDALRKSEQRLNRAQEIAHLGSWELDLVNNRLNWSDEVYRMFGFQPQEFGATYEAFLGAVHPDDRAAVDNAYSGSVRESRDTYEIEHRIVKHSSGEVRIVHEKCEHFRDEAGQIMRSVGMVHDITERKRAEDALRRAHDELELRVQERTEELATANKTLLKEIAERKEIERKLRLQTTAMEAAANGILITDRQGNIQWTNPALTEISGYHEEDLIGQSTHLFNSGQHDAAYYRQMWDTILSGQVWRGETINKRKDGNLYIEEQTITPVRDETGQIPHFIAIKQDITKRKQDEQELERRNEELQIISNAERNQHQFSEALVAAALHLNKSLKLSDVLSLILEQIREVIPYQLADIALLEGESFYDASHQGDLAWPESLVGTNNRFFLESFPLLNKISQSGKPVLVLDTKEEPDWVMLEGLTWTRSFLSAPLLVEKKVIGFVNLFSDQPNFFAQEMSNRLVAFAAHAAVAIQNAWLFEQVQASTERLQSLSRRLVEIQENERLYISRELHDESGQVLTSLLVDLRLLEKNIHKPSSLQKIVTEMEGSLNGVIENLHRIAMALRPASLDHVGLVAALRQHTESMAEKNGLNISLTCSGVIERLPANIETVIYRIVQEALTNIVRHAHATRVDVVLTVRDGNLIVIIEDDGIGFDPDVAQTDKHLGLFGMRERTEMIDGKLIIESSPGKGTTIMMEVGYADTISSRG